MTIALTIVAAVAVMAIIYVVVIRGSLGLLKQRFREEPDLKKDAKQVDVPGKDSARDRSVSDRHLEDDLPADIEY